MREWTGLDNLSDRCLYELARDVIYRIGSYGGSEEDFYVKQQQNLLTAIDNELDRRMDKV